MYSLCVCNVLCVWCVQVMRLHSELENKAILCESYEKQMQRVQEQLLKEIEEKDFQIDGLKSDRTKLEVITCDKRLCCGRLPWLLAFLASGNHSQ